MALFRMLLATARETLSKKRLADAAFAHPYRAAIECGRRLKDALGRASPAGGKSVVRSGAAQVRLLQSGFGARARRPVG